MCKSLHTPYPNMFPFRGCPIPRMGDRASSNSKRNPHAEGRSRAGTLGSRPKGQPPKNTYNTHIINNIHGWHRTEESDKSCQRPQEHLSTPLACSARVVEKCHRGEHEAGEPAPFVAAIKAKATRPVPEKNEKRGGSGVDNGKFAGRVSEISRDRRAILEAAGAPACAEESIVDRLIARANVDRAAVNVKPRRGQRTPAGPSRSRWGQQVLGIVDASPGEQR